jgi:hypothetical protein
MKKKKNNQYESRARKKSFLSGLATPLPTEKNIGNSVIETGKDLLIGVIGGGLLGAAIGRPSLLIGAVVTAGGHYFKNSTVSVLGVGMMAANGFQNGAAVNGPEKPMDAVKNRINTFGKNFKQKIYLDKVIKSKPSSTSNATMQGLENVQYFNYPTDTAVNGELDFSGLDEVERQLSYSAGEFDMAGAEFEMGALEPSEMLI